MSEASLRQKISSQSYEPVDAEVALILLLNGFEHKVECLCLSEFSRCGEFLRDEKGILGGEHGRKTVL